MIRLAKYIPYLIAEYRLIKHFEQWPREEITRYQLRALRHILGKAKQIPFYRNLYKDTGTFDLTVRSMDDLAKLPVIDKALCRKNGYEEYFLKKNIPRSIVTPTSGSTGHPFQVRIPERLELSSPIRVIHAMKQFGWRPRDKGLEIWVGEMKSHKKIMRRLGLLRSVSLFEPPEKVWDILKKDKPDYIFSNRTYLETLQEYLQRNNHPYQPKFLMSSASEVYEHQRTKLEKYFRSRLLNVYGCLEAPTMAYSCPEFNHFHVFQTTAIAEVVNKRIIEGEECGDLVVTNLCNDLMPFIRYNTGDVVKVAPDICGCGRNSQILGEIMGRSDDIIKFRDGKSFNYLHFWMRLKKPLLMDHIDQIEQYKIWFYKKSEDILFQFRLNDRVGAEEGASIVDKIVKENFSDIRCSAEIVDHIPLSSSGKFKIIEIVEDR